MSKGPRARAEKAPKPVVVEKVSVLASKEEDELVKRYGPLTVEELCAIVSACQQSRVLSLSFRGLKLKFACTPASVSDSEVLPGPDEATPAQGRKRRTAEELERQRAALAELAKVDVGEAPDNLSGIRAENHEVSQDELAMLLVTDPSAYEALANNDPEVEGAEPS